MKKSTSLLEESLGHEFSDRALLQQALTHRSAGSHNNERLEFLGDAVLQLAVTHHLFVEFPGLNEGEMAKVRAAVVNEVTLAELARTMDLGPLVLLGRGETLRDILDSMQQVAEGISTTGSLTLTAPSALPTLSPTTNSSSCCTAGTRDA